MRRLDADSQPSEGDLSACDSTKRERDRHDNDVGYVRQEVVEQHPRRPRARRPRGHHVVRLPQRQHLGADYAGHPHPAEQGEHPEDEEVVRQPRLVQSAQDRPAVELVEEVLHPGTDSSGYQEKQQDLGQAEEGVGDAHDQIVDSATGVSREQPQRHPQGQPAGEDGGGRDDDRGLGGPHHPREEVAPQTVGPQRVLEAGPGERVREIGIGETVGGDQGGEDAGQVDYHDDHQPHHSQPLVAQPAKDLERGPRGDVLRLQRAACLLVGH